MIRTVTVLQDDIDNGQRRNYLRCAIALAARRELADLLPEGESEVSADTWLLAWPKNNEINPKILGRLPAEARAFIKQFDNDEAVEPFKFELELELEACC